MRKRINDTLLIFGISAVLISTIIMAAMYYAGAFEHRGVLTAAVCAVLLSAAAYIAAGTATDKIMKPIEDAARDKTADGAMYDELKLIMRMSSKSGIDEETEKMRREFTANVSHELKTPLTTISGYAQMMSTGIARTEDMRLFSAKIEKESARMLKLIDDIINLSALDEGEEIENPKRIDLSQITAEAISVLEKAAKERGIQIFYSGGEAYIMGNPTLISELVYNLIDNAIKYNTENGSIRVFAGETAGGVELSVKDTGIGIPQNAQDRIFERFYRVDKSHSKKVGGTGLGLSIVKHICSLHGASVRVKSEVGKGSTFYVLFPKENV